MPRPSIAPILLVPLLAFPAAAQERLTLADAISRATTAHPAARIAATAEQEAATRVDQARAGYLPKLDVAEGWQRGNQPVFVFGSLLSQRQFTEANFAIDQLNHPDPISNHRLGISLQQVLFDGLATPAAVRAAKAGVAAAGQQRALTSQGLALDVTAAYGQAVQAEAALAAARGAVEAAGEDLKRVRARRDAGYATEADVLAVQVHAADVRARQIAADGDLQVARARLNDLVGAPLDSVFALGLDTSPAPVDADAPALETEALAGRPEVKLAALRIDGAQAQYEMARAAWMPQVAFQSGWEFNGETFGDRASSWIVGAEVRFNLFRGFADKARVSETRLAIERQTQERELAERQVRLDVRSARARVETARARGEVSRDALARAKESQRIVRDRYEAGLEDVTALLRAAQAVQQAEALDIASRVGLLVETAALERSLGRLPR